MTLHFTNLACRTTNKGGLSTSNGPGRFFAAASFLERVALSAHFENLNLTRLQQRRFFEYSQSFMIRQTQVVQRNFISESV